MSPKRAGKEKVKYYLSVRLFLYFFLILVAAGVIGLGIGTYKYFATDVRVPHETATLEFTYDGAAEGVAPDGSKFYISDIYDESILNEALYISGLSDKITVDELNSCMIVNGTYPEDIVKKLQSYESLLDFSSSKAVVFDSYHPTQFNVTIYNHFKNNVSPEELKILVNAVINSYRTWFDNHYLRSFSLSSFDEVYDSKDSDYSQRLEIIRRELEFMSGYASELYEEDSAFKYLGKNFNDIYILADSTITNSIDKLNASITMNAITKNASRLLTQYNYEIKMLNNELIHAQNNLKSVNSLLESYDKYEVLYLATSDSVTKIDGNSSETYDSLVASRVEISNKITEINSSISQYKLKLNDLNNSTGASSRAQVEQVDAQVASLEKQTLELEEQLSKMITAYNRTKFGENSIYVGEAKYVAGSIGSYLVTCIKCVGPLCMLVVISFGFVMIKRKSGQYYMTLQ